MGDSKPTEDGRAGTDIKAILARSVKISLLLIGILLVAVFLAAWFGGTRPDLPFEYGGFD